MTFYTVEQYQQKIQDLENQLHEQELKFKALRDRWMPTRKYRPIDAEAWAIVDEIVTKHGVTRKNLADKFTYPDRAKLARAEVCAKLHGTGRYTKSSIAKILSRDHSTIVGYIRLYYKLTGENHD